MAKSFTNSFCPMNVLAGLSRVYIRASVNLILSAIEERMQKLFNAAILIALMKDDTTVRKKTLSRS